MDNSTEKRDKFLECPLGGDETNDCADCIYSVDYHFVDGNCVKRHKQDDSQDKCPICKYPIDHFPVAHSEAHHVRLRELPVEKLVLLLLTLSRECGIE